MAAACNIMQAAVFSVMSTFFLPLAPLCSYVLIMRSSDYITGYIVL